MRLHPSTCQTSALLTVFLLERSMNKAEVLLTSAFQEGWPPVPHGSCGCATYATYCDAK